MKLEDQDWKDPKWIRNMNKRFGYNPQRDFVAYLVLVLTIALLTIGIAALIHGCVVAPRPAVKVVLA